MEFSVWSLGKSKLIEYLLGCIRANINRMKTTVYTKTGCPWCKEMIDFLNKNGVKYEEKNVSTNPDFLEQLVNISGQEKAPTLNIDGKIVADAGVEDVKDLF